MKGKIHSVNMKYLHTFFHTGIDKTSYKGYVTKCQHDDMQLALWNLANEFSLPYDKT